MTTIKKRRLKPVTIRLNLYRTSLRKPYQALPAKDVGLLHFATDRALIHQASIVRFRDEDGTVRVLKDRHNELKGDA